MNECNREGEGRGGEKMRGVVMNRRISTLPQTQTTAE